jgi:subtilisin family serine protease
VRKRSLFRWVAVVAAVVACTAGLPSVAQAAAVGHFLVIGPIGDLSATEASIRGAGGEIVRSLPQIGVVFATSDRSTFAQDVRGRPGVTQAGSSRALVEFLPPAPAAGQFGQFTGQIRAPGAEITPLAEPLEPNQWNMKLVKAAEAHNISVGSPNVLVGVLDSGIDADHPDLVANLDASRSVGCGNNGVPDQSPAAWEDSLGHGTHVSGIIAAARNGVGVVGVAPKVRIAMIKVSDEPQRKIYPEYAICGLVWAAERGVDVTNASFIVDPWLKACVSNPDQSAIVTAVRRAVDYAAGHDIVNVAALGNDNWDLSHSFMDSRSPTNQTPMVRTVDDSCPALPTELPGVVGVSSIGPGEHKWTRSNYGLTDVDLTAPGGNHLEKPNTPDGNGRVLSTFLNGGYFYAQGTSMAAPHVTGVAALIRSTHPSWTASQVVAALAQQADRKACPPNPYDPTGDGQFWAICEGGTAGTGFYGAGLTDALDAVTK